MLTSYGENTFGGFTDLQTLSGITDLRIHESTESFLISLFPFLHNSVVPQLRSVYPIPNLGCYRNKDSDNPFAVCQERIRFSWIQISIIPEKRYPIIALPSFLKCDRGFR